MTAHSIEEGPIVWRPSPDVIEKANLTRFMHQHGLPSFQSLLERAQADVAWFTEATLRFLDIRFRRPYSQVLDPSLGPAWPRWCVGADMNIVESCLDRHLATPAEHQLALVWEGEEGATRSLTYGELDTKVAQAANGLRGLGLGKGDVVALFMPMTPEVVIALLAIAKIGGVILPLFSAGVVMIGLSLLFWVGTYLAFTPHGIIRYRLGVIQAMLDSALVVRWNTLGALGFIGVAIGVSWLTNLIWDLPQSASWFSILGLLGHAFVSAMIIVGSYAFYQARREWLTAMRSALAMQSAERSQTKDGTG